MTIPQPNEHLILTGAGFTKNFGGYLASEMWAVMLGHPRVQASPSIMTELRADLNFENVHHRILTGNFTDDDKNVIAEAVIDAYNQLDDIVRNWRGMHDPLYPIHELWFQDFIAQATRKDGNAYFFTLNQDLFLERHYRDYDTYIHNSRRPTLPGVQQHDDWFTQNFSGPIREEHYVIVPDGQSIPSDWPPKLESDRFNYIKLHGSTGWRSAPSESVMVIGADKEAMIKSQPLLAWYFDIFKSVLNHDGLKLLVIGYGFGDRHINEVIADGVKMHGLQLFFIDPSPPSAFQEKLCGSPRGRDIWDGMHGYFSCSLVEIFIGDYSKKTRREALYKQFLGISAPL